MIRTILQMGHPLLREVSTEATDPNETIRVVSDLRDTLYDFRERNVFGRGISAVQIGEPIRAVFLHLDGPLPLINPVVRRGEGDMAYWDDCFSFPDLLVWVKRSSRVTVDYQDMEGWPQTIEAERDVAELLQHEIDHLDGILAVERAVDDRSFCLRDEFERQKMSKWVRGMR